MSITCIKDVIRNINIVIGCPIGCSYCYARINCLRFHSTEDFSVPVFFEEKLRLLDKKKSRAYFLTGQSDLAYWKEEWLEKVFSKMEENPDTQYLFLSKRPERLSLKKTPENGWFGVTVTSSKEKQRIEDLKKNVSSKNLHITFEPLFDDIGEADLDGISWIVIGTETGSRKGKVVTRREWVYSLLDQARKKGIPVFMKEDLLGIMKEEEMVQEFPSSFLYTEKQERIEL